ncbi:Xaa-Pro peptidase family protein [Marinilabiliaceae bacterium ANBcel2]|nr:Xaa-Pro peptidase family protein [Marinilabiliaceae bacterium ANBcel2]
MDYKTPLSELQNRMARFKERMDKDCPNWQTAVIFSKLNLLYFTGSMPEGMLIIEREKEPVLWVRQSYERVLKESFFNEIKPMKSYRDAATAYTNLSNTVHIETSFVPLDMYKRFNKHFPFKNYESLDHQIAMTRAVKSSWELNFMREAGKLHQKITLERIPQLLKEGISEAEFAADLYKAMIEEGHMGTARFNMFDTEMLIGQIGFGDSSIIPTTFNGPGGHRGMYPAVPVLGSRERKLKKGDMVFVDAGVGINGYHTDKTQLYMYNDSIPEEALKTHNECVKIQYDIAEMLKPGVTPAHIYETIINNLPEGFSENFMGYGKRQVKFLGHAIGLTIDEIPVIANGFDEPLQENMVFALEPKKGIKDFGMVGAENTFIVTPDGGENITGDQPSFIEI